LDRYLFRLVGLWDLRVLWVRLRRLCPLVLLGLVDLWGLGRLVDRLCLLGLVDLVGRCFLGHHLVLCLLESVGKKQRLVRHHLVGHLCLVRHCRLVVLEGLEYLVGHLYLGFLVGLVVQRYLVLRVYLVVQLVLVGMGCTVVGLEFGRLQVVGHQEILGYLGCPVYLDDLAFLVYLFDQVRLEYSIQHIGQPAF